MKLIRYGVLALVLAVLASSVWTLKDDAGSILDSLKAFPTIWLVPALACATWNYAVRFLRWQFYVRKLGISGVRSWSSLLVFVSGFAMTLTPGRAGEFSKSYWLRELAGPEQAPVARTAPMVVAERLSDGLGMLLLASAGFAVYQFGAATLLALAAVFGVAVVLLQVPGLPTKLLAVVARVPGLGRLAHASAMAVESTTSLLSGWTLIISVAMSAVAWAGECTALYVVLLGLGIPPGVETLNQAFFSFSTASLVGSASLLPGGLGAAEGALAALLQAVGNQPRAIAVAAALIVRLCTLWFAVGLGALSLAALTYQSRRREQPRMGQLPSTAQ
ncbi:MAG: flippase-like domain-containing protein [Chloroflexi bacterium]|nr:flippase-like domain-containing protein [Chloroflexota bacterium]